MNKIKKLLQRKHLLITGKNEIDRKNFVKELILELDYEIFHFPSNMKSLNDYLNFVKKKTLYTPFYESKSYNNNQILDFHRDWISENNSLVILEELDQMEIRWKLELVRLYTNELIERKKGKEKIHLILTQENENGLLNELAEIINHQRKDELTKRQYIHQYIEHIEL